MALVSRHYRVAEAVLAAIVADSDIMAIIPEAQWRLQKKFWNRYQPWLPGGFVVPQRRRNPAHENERNRLLMPVLVGAAWPADGDLTDELEERMALVERIEQMFDRPSKADAPAALRALSSALTGADEIAYQAVTVQPGDQFIDNAFRDGLDAFATIVEVDITARKRAST